MANPKTLKPFKKGHDPRRNLKGRPKGTKNFKTMFEMACKEVAESLNLGQEPDKVMLEIIKRGIKEIFKGNYSFYKDTLDRYFGKATEKAEIGLKIEKIAELEELLKEWVEKDKSEED
jgi:hypothetical protein